LTHLPATAATLADRPRDGAVQLQEIAAPRPLMESVHVLGNDYIGWEEALQSRDGDMRGIGRGRGHRAVPPCVPTPDLRGISAERLGGGQLLGPHPLPQAAGAPKRIEP